MVVVAPISGCGQTSHLKANHLRGLEPTVTIGMPNFVLEDTSHNAFDFASQDAGHVTFLYFGYTHCPDSCPTAMSDLASALRRIGTDSSQVRVVFVTTDPDRDTPAVIRRWLNQFSTDFIGLTGSDVRINAALSSLGLSSVTPGPAIPTLAGHPDQHPSGSAQLPKHHHFGPLGYSEAHIDMIFAFDRKQRLRALYPGGSSVADIATDLKSLMAT